MNHRLRKFAVAGSIALGVIGMSASSAFAGVTLNQVGSDTTYWTQQGIANAYNINAASNPNADLVVNTPPIVTPPFPSGIVAPADADCSKIVYSTTDTVPPNGSGAGKTALSGDTTGCVDLSRSSSGRGGSDPSTFEYYAYALGALDWVRFAGNTTQNLSQDSLIKIYTCDPATGAPFYPTWQSVPENATTGMTGDIVKYIPQTSSGTYSFFKSKLLGGATPDANCDVAHKGTFLQEHTAMGVDPATKARAIYVYDYGQWYAQSKLVVPDQRNGSVFGSINGVKPAAATVNTGTTRFFGTRYLYTVLKTDSPRYTNAMQYAGAGDLDGNPATPADNGFICSGKAGLTIKATGFFALKKTADPNNGGLLSYCLKNPTAL